MQFSLHSNFLFHDLNPTFLYLSLSIKLSFLSTVYLCFEQGTFSFVTVTCSHTAYLVLLSWMLSFAAAVVLRPDWNDRTVTSPVGMSEKKNNSSSVILWQSSSCHCEFPSATAVKETGGHPCHRNMSKKVVPKDSVTVQEMWLLLEGWMCFLAHVFYCMWPEYDLWKSHPRLKVKTII